MLLYKFVAFSQLEIFAQHLGYQLIKASEFTAPMVDQFHDETRIKSHFIFSTPHLSNKPLRTSYYGTALMKFWALCCSHMATTKL